MKRLIYTTDVQEVGCDNYHTFIEYILLSYTTITLNFKPLEGRTIIVTKLEEAGLDGRRGGRVHKILTP